MKPLEKTMKSLLAMAIIIALSISLQAQQERLYYAVEIDGVLCGYSTSDITKVEYGGKSMKQSLDTVRLMLKALGQDMNLEIASQNIYEPESYKMAFNSSKYIYDDIIRVETSTEIYKDYALYHSLEKQFPDTVDISDGLIFDNPVKSPFLLEDFSDGKTTEKTYKVFDYVKGRITSQKYTLITDEKMALAGNFYDTYLFNIYNSTDGTNVKIWVDSEHAVVLQFEILNRKIYLTTKEVIKKIRTADLDNTIFARVDRNIPGFMDMRYLKVKANIRSAGEEISVESLNFPGQKFEGTVHENHIQGVFEIEPFRYDGSNAPSFPSIYKEEELQKYQEPEIFIESDHPDIVEKAFEITRGATDSWEAAIRLSEWVGKEIAGAIPGGTTAIGTLHTREGECGSHSRLLTAFCRAVDIPARLSVGCMYSPWYGGSFGQHAWTEVYMGEEIGWVAVDATILEYDYVDAGHIKLGELTSFHPESMEILEYRLDGEAAELIGKGMPDEYKAIMGPYTNKSKRDVLDVQYVDGYISIDVKGRMMLALHSPDEEGRMYAQLSDKVYFKFVEEKMFVVENVFALKKLDGEIVLDEEMDEALKPLIGPYVILQIQKEFTAIWHDGGLAMMVPDVEEPRPLEKTDTENRWRDPVNLKEYSFKVKEDGTVGGMDIYITSVLEKGATAAWIIEKTIKEDGLEAAEKKFWELWDNRALDLDHTERDLNNLGYKYLSAKQMDEALMVFKLNVEAYPQSWNAYDSYAEGLVKNGDLEDAIINYQKSLELNPENENGKEALEGLLTMDKK